MSPPPPPNPIFKAHLRIARPTPSITALLPFYTTGLGFTILSSFTAHAGFDGVMLGHASLPYHLEFTTQEGHDAGQAPTKDNLLVFYLEDKEEWEKAVERMEKTGFAAVGSANPWWDGGGKGRTFEDGDGWRVVLWNGGWGRAHHKRYPPPSLAPSHRLHPTRNTPTYTPQTPHSNPTNMLEIAVFNHASALTAASSGADRLELCADYAAGGVTPSIRTLMAIRRAVPDIPIHVMIRPRGGNFVYSAAEFERMRSDIALFSTVASGFVFGVLDANGRVNVARNAGLVDIARPLPCTFHRAIDETPDLEEAVGMVVGCGFRSVLTSGGGRVAVDGVETVRKAQGKFGERISFVVGGGVRSGNVGALKRGTGVEWVHSAAITGEGENVDGEEVRRIQDVLKSLESDGKKQEDGSRDEEMGDAS
ncbi:hypothetical protein CC86DRAFT_430248 [Ophiobolus disseminans]|uniref:Copper homeostasis protein cutC homolog n=1 Tax=Ophiobolus disseminans TaxID=1469910 RepID=A0A6A6ZH46_9PLEO|nr:hypothetical protein CC86DRAFT_430248 [Ophiobolus disseminans]